MISEVGRMEYIVKDHIVLYKMPSFFMEYNFSSTNIFSSMEDWENR